VSDQRLSGRGSVMSFVLMTGLVRSLAVRGRLGLDADAVLGDDALALVASVAQDRDGRRHEAKCPEEEDHAVVRQ